MRIWNRMRILYVWIYETLNTSYNFQGIFFIELRKQNKYQTVTYFFKDEYENRYERIELFFI